MTDLRTHAESDAESRATVELDPSREGERVAPELYGEFGEHLYSPWNVSNALEAQALFDPTDEPERVAPATNRAVVDDEGRVTVSLPPFSLVRVTAERDG